MLKTATMLLPALALFTACTTEPPPETDQPNTRPLISNTRCINQNGYSVGDIGDGRIHRDDFLCPNGQPPIGTIKPEPGNQPIEGAVCCQQ